jgi:hypothetical protein
MNSSVPDSTRLAERVDALLADTLGAYPFRPESRSSRRWPPWLVALLSGAAYAVLFCALPWLLGSRHRELLQLSLWGSCYLAFAVLTARSTSAAVLDTVRTHVIPDLSPETAASIERDLARRFRPIRLNLLSATVAALALAVSALAIWTDLKTKPGRLEIAWWGVGFLILYFTAARTTDVARFYGVFASNLVHEKSRIFPLDPVHSIPVLNVARIAKRVLLFWVGIGISVLTLLIFFRHLAWFSLFVVPTASFFSLGFGTLMFLHSEWHIRRVVDEAAMATLRSLDTELTSLLDRFPRLDEKEWSNLKELTSVRAQVANAGRYQTIGLSALSIFVPFVGPLVTVLINWSSPNSLWSRFNLPGATP